MGGDELLLLADGAEEPERVRPEPNDADRCDRHQAQHARERHAPALARPTAAEHEEREQQPGGELDPHAAGQCERGGARPARGRARAGCAQQQREADREQQQRVVVGAADRQHEEHGVQAEERHGERARAPEAAGRLGGEPDRPEAGKGRKRLQGP